MTKLENFSVGMIKRSEIKLADYNPRAITDEARAALAGGIEALGLLAPLVWNSTSGTLVGGHQRISILDEKNGWPENDYELTVSIVSLGEQQEREANILLNNQAAQGTWDVVALHEMVEQWSLDDNAMGFGEAGFEGVFTLEDAPEIAPPDSAPSPGKVGCELVVHFEDEFARDDFCAHFGLPERGRVSGDDMAARLRAYAGT